VIVAGVDTIDASLVDADFLGHSGFATANPLMQDLYYLVPGSAWTPTKPTVRFGSIFLSARYVLVFQNVKCEGKDKQHSPDPRT
jgi:hypothetical protein